ncbi:MAG: hypothetical protein QOG40_1270, partial [Solirubrobacteraceae bacterium]|nr:hypothetical protein [Solirubrobacteraceae bacterium]
LTEAGSVSKLSVYLAPTTTAGQEVLKGLIYSDSGGKPEALLGTSAQLTFKSTNAAGWYDLVFSSPVKLAAGNYWIGLMTGATGGVAGWRYDNVTGTRAWNANAYTAGPTTPFGAATIDAQQPSLYATYSSETSSGVPVNTSPPTITGTAQQGQTLTANMGSWSNSPTGYAYEWLRCGSAGGSCKAIAEATASKYTLTEADVGKTVRVSVVASNASGPSAAASSAQTALVAAPAGPPVNTSPPTITGTAQQGRTLTANTGSWTNSPTGYAYEWLRCGSGGGSCNPIAEATASTYTLSESDVGKTVRVSVIASNASGPSAAASSAQTALVTTGAGISHLEYVLQDGTTSVYDMDNEFKLAKTIPMPQDNDEVRGVSVAPSTHIMYVMHGGDGPINGSGNGSVLAWDLVGEKALWDSKLNTGIDSGQVSPDAKKLYVPTGENTSTGLWNVLNAANGEVTGTIQGGTGPHNTVVSNDGRYVYMGGRTSNILYAYETETGKTKEIGPMIGTVRPLTVNGSNTIAFTTATNFDGFQVSSVTTGKVLFTVSFGEVPNGFRFTAPSHGISISPDERQAYVIDAVHKLIQFYDVSKVKEGVAPSQIGTVAVAGLGTGNETGCKYDCTYGGWLQLSVDGRYLFVGDSGEVIDTATRKVVTTLSTLAQTKKSIEVDWQNGVPIATSGRSGVGGVG